MPIPLRSLSGLAELLTETVGMFLTAVFLGPLARNLILCLIVGAGNAVISVE